MLSALLFAQKYWKLIALASLVMGAWGWHSLKVRSAYKAGIESERTAARIEAGKRIVEMEKSDEAFRNLPALDRCRAFMRSVGVPESECR